MKSIYCTACHKEKSKDIIKLNTQCQCPDLSFPNKKIKKDKARERRKQLAKWIYEIRLELYRLKGMYDYKRRRYMDDFIDNGVRNPKLKMSFETYAEKHGSTIEGLETVLEKLCQDRVKIISMYKIL